MMAFFSADGVELHYEMTGEGFPVVFSHEFGGDNRSWDPQVRFFARLYRCITYNHRGFPPSSVPEDLEAYSQELLIEDLHNLLEHLGVEQAHLVGLSLGANVVLNFALRYPEMCRSIVVAGCGSGSTDREAFERRMNESSRLIMSKGMGEFTANYSLSPNRLTFKRKDPKGWAEFHAQLAEHSALGSARMMQGVMLRRPTIFSLREQLNQLRVPTLLVVGDEDDACVEPGLFMKREIPGAGLLLFPNSGHTVNLEEPALFNQAVLHFFHMVEANRWTDLEPGLYS
jgi:pimeloyl-ACP methyl ester carboxylesterase